MTTDAMTTPNPICNNRALLDRINASLDREQPKIDAILEAYHVPLDHRGAGAPTPR